MRKSLAILATCALLSIPAISTTADASVKTAAHKTGEYIDDSALTTKVKAALMHSKHLKSLHIAVQSTEGVVTLSGTVPTSAQIDQAVAVTKKVKGVTDVHNALELKPAKKED